MRSLEPPLVLGISIGGFDGSGRCAAGGSSRRSRICPPLLEGGAVVPAAAGGSGIVLSAMEPLGLTGWYG